MEEPSGIFSLYKKKKCIYAKVLEPVYPNTELKEAEQVLDLERRVLDEYNFEKLGKGEMNCDAMAI